MTPTQIAIAINAQDIRDNHPQAWLPLVMLCAAPDFSTTSQESADLLVERSLIERRSDGSLHVNDMIRDVVLQLAGHSDTKENGR